MTSAAVDAFIASLKQMVERGDVAFTKKQISERSTLAAPTIKQLIGLHITKGWLRELHKERKEQWYVITNAAPFIVQNKSLEAVALLQSYSMYWYEHHQLIYGYGTALYYLGLAKEPLGEKRYCWRLDPTVSPPRLPNDLPFKRSVKSPTRACEWSTIKLFASRRHPRDIPHDQIEDIFIDDVRIRCTGPVRTIIDCWLRPDLVEGGIATVESAMIAYKKKVPNSYITRTIEQLQQSGTDQREDMQKQFNIWANNVS